MNWPYCVVLISISKYSSYSFCCGSLTVFNLSRVPVPSRTAKLFEVADSWFYVTRGHPSAAYILFTMWNSFPEVGQIYGHVQNMHPHIVISRSGDRQGWQRWRKEANRETCTHAHTQTHFLPVMKWKSGGEHTYVFISCRAVSLTLTVTCLKPIFTELSEQWRRGVHKVILDDSE